MALDEKQSQRVLSAVLAAARKVAPEAQVLARVDSGREANTRFARNEITSTGDVEESLVTVEVSFGRRHAKARSNQTDPDSLRALVERCARMARLSPEDPEHMPVLGPQRYLASPASHDMATARLGAQVRAEAAQAAIAAAQAQKLTAAGFYTHDESASALASTAGLRSYHRATSANFSLTVRTEDGQGSGWASAWAHRASEVDTSSVVRVAVDKAVRSARPRRLEPGRYTVILEPAAVANMLGFLFASLGAREADEGRSFFSRPGGGTRVGERLFGEAITLRSDPTDPATPASPVDEQGLPLRPRTWLDKGVLTGLVYDRHWAARQGKEPTGQPSCAHLLGGTASAQELLAGVDKGLLITRLWYTRWVDPQALLITGLTRDGVFLVEKGEVVGPVNNFRFNESPVAVLRNADLLTRETVNDGRLRVPALRTHEFNMASISEAV